MVTNAGQIDFSSSARAVAIGPVGAPLIDGALRVSSRDLAASYLLCFKFDEYRTHLKAQGILSSLLS